MMHHHILDEVIPQTKHPLYHQTSSNDVGVSLLRFNEGVRTEIYGPSWAKHTSN
jgi:hypothetical protein